jgi:hypothetical protein
MKWAGQVASTGHRTNACRVLVGQANRKIPLEDTEVEWKVILNNSYGYRLVWLRTGDMGRALVRRVLELRVP